MQSMLAQVHLAEGKVVRRIPDIGVNSHGLVGWRGLFVMLSSKETRLVTVNPETEEVLTIWQVCFFPSQCCQLPDARRHKRPPSKVANAKCRCVPQVASQLVRSVVVCHKWRPSRVRRWQRAAGDQL